jgi:hypothetical protein
MLLYWVPIQGIVELNLIPPPNKIKRNLGFISPLLAFCFLFISNLFNTNHRLLYSFKSKLHLCFIFHYGLLYELQLTPKGRSPFWPIFEVFGPFLKFGQAIVDAIFVQKISTFRWICGLVLASRCTHFYKIPIFGLGIIPQKQNPYELKVARATKKLFIF